ncbi:MAG: DUF2384 domain-containing protein [Ectothiorhodospiraceae bacterium]|nr:DUF2384 domain-containing protein [Ectothiorhodospiraceae bacterium]
MKPTLTQTLGFLRAIWADHILAKPMRLTLYARLFMSEPASKLNHQPRVDLTILVIDLLNNWQIDNAEKIILLGLPDKTRSRAMTRFAQHSEKPQANMPEAPLPFDEPMLERIEHLRGIADSLRLANPRKSQAGALWLKRPLPRLGKRTPLAIMLENGLEGLVTVRKHLDCSFDGYTDQQNNTPR